MERLQLEKNKSKKTDKTTLNNTNEFILNTIQNSGETLDKFSNYQYAPTLADNTDLLLKINSNNLLFNKDNSKQIQRDNNNNLSLGDSNYNEKDRKKSLPDIS
jgi:hypothetical protein